VREPLFEGTEQFIADGIGLSPVTPVPREAIGVVSEDRGVAKQKILLDRFVGNAGTVRVEGEQSMEVICPTSGHNSGDKDGTGVAVPSLYL
jgi:hypothetical protein